jgi:putative aldouronate transport system permease protein
MAMKGATVARPAGSIRSAARTDASAGRRRRTIRRHWQLYLVIALPMAFLITFNYYPMIGVQIAFRNYNPVQGMWHSPWTGLTQFRAFVNGPYFWQVIRNTLRISLYSIVIGTPATIILALAINEVKHARFKKLAQMVSYAPYFISTVVVVGIIQIVLSPDSGPLVQIAKLFGVHHMPNLLASPGAFPSIYVWSGIWQETGYGAVIYLAALSAVNPELYEAARIDGASRLQRIRHIDLPSITPTIVILLIMSVAGILNVGFEKVFLLQNPLNNSGAEVISTYVYKTGLLDSNFSFAAAVGLFNSIVGLVLLVIVNFVARFVSDESLF